MNAWRRWLFCACLAMAGSQAMAGDALVLVASAASPLRTPDSLAIRKAFMGLSTAVDGHAVRALMNQSDRTLRPLFLQNIVGFSEQAFQRRVLTLRLQQGSAEPAAYGDEAELVRALLADGRAISFMWQSHAARRNDLRILKVLWQD